MLQWKKRFSRIFNRNGLDINHENKNGKSLLFNACFSGNKYLVEYLVELGADINKEVKKNGEESRK